jgi:2,4-dienoyl-CoA reductase-like NADH-dependent reductase (Old Yellow Enzyme family)
MPDLASPLRLPCGVELPNRVALAPLTNTQSQADGTLGQDELRWLLRRAEGGFGLLSTCAAYVSDEGKGWEGQLGIATDAHLPGLTRLASALVGAGSVPVVQLYHGGSKAFAAPGRTLSTVDGGPDGPRGATKVDLARVQADFVAAALRAEQAGFAGVEIHGANGYLFTQFLAPDDNPRTDAWGGGLEGRARLLRDVLRAVRAATKPGFAVGVRISPVDTWDRRGLVLADGVQLSAWLAEDGADFIHLSLRDAAGEGPFEPGGGVVAWEVREAVPAEVAIVAAGGVRRPADAVRAMRSGVDVVALGKIAIGVPDWPRVSARAGWNAPATPWTKEHLRSVDVGEAFVGYLGKFPGLVEGGASARRP